MSIIVVYFIVCFRLESYDRNQNFGRPEDTPKEFTMDLPDISKYKDIHNGTELVDVTLTLVTTYLNQFDTKLENSAIQPYKERYLIYVRSTEIASYQRLKSVCRAEMKRSVTYNLQCGVWVSSASEKTGQAHLESIHYGMHSLGNTGMQLVQVSKNNFTIVSNPV